ncbi:MAG: thiamine biosynthesis protein ThiS [Actinobacteria bacterium]|nr:thiamine biosynthesis protein ThiS [Actinomycetota bacterium]
MMPEIQLQVNGEDYQIQVESITILGLLSYLGVSPNGKLVELNQDHIFRSGQFDDIYLSSGDRIELIQFMGGGS